MSYLCCRRRLGQTSVIQVEGILPTLPPDWRTTFAQGIIEFLQDYYDCGAWEAERIWGDFCREVHDSEGFLVKLSQVDFLFEAQDIGEMQ